MALSPGPPRRPSARPADSGKVHLSWEPPLSCGSDPIHTYMILGRCGGEASVFSVLASVPVGAECSGAAPAITLGRAQLGKKPTGWWEFRIAAINSAAQGPHSPPSLPLIVRGGEEAGRLGRGGEEASCSRARRVS